MFCPTYSCASGQVMPEGPSIVILKDEASIFVGSTIDAASGNAKIDMDRLPGQRVVAVRNFGKQFLLELDDVTVRIHLLLFGSYRVNARKDVAPRLRLQFESGEINFYACSVRLIEGALDDAYDWSVDVMSDAWRAAAALKRLRAHPEMLVCDALLDQTLFAGVGNIIKNEVLFRIRVHPLSQVGALPAAKQRELVNEARRYSFEFLAWKQAFVLAKHWCVHNRGLCPRDHIKLKRGYLGLSDRRTFYCERCQKCYRSEPLAATQKPRTQKAPRRRSHAKGSNAD
jgi:endonuclease VIII